MKYFKENGWKAGYVDETAIEKTSTKVRIIDPVNPQIVLPRV